MKITLELSPSLLEDLRLATFLDPDEWSRDMQWAAFRLIHAVQRAVNQPSEMGEKDRLVYSRGNSPMKGTFTGGHRRCSPQASCSGVAYGIRWEDRNISFVCRDQITWDDNLGAYRLK